LQQLTKLIQPTQKTARLISSVGSAAGVTNQAIGHRCHLLAWPSAQQAACHWSTPHSKMFAQINVEGDQDATIQVHEKRLFW
jgi:hypothetical protein